MFCSITKQSLIVTSTACSKLMNRQAKDNAVLSSESLISSLKNTISTCSTLIHVFSLIY